MAECCAARCSQERRSFRRELQKWGRNLLYLVGLESVTEDIMGSENWHKIMEPYFSLEPRELSDWDKEETCYLCNNRKDLGQDTGSDIKVSEENLHNNLSDTISYPLCNTKHYYGDLLPLTYPDPGKDTYQDQDQPLDLSVGQKDHSMFPTRSILNDALKPPLLKVPQITAKIVYPTGADSKFMPNFFYGKTRKRPDGSKRSYTDQELQAAVGDIMSGKLGTRRAAVLYGIPRSTLRNKVYKLEAESEAAAQASLAAAAGKVLSLGELLQNNSPMSGSAATATLRELIQNKIGFNRRKFGRPVKGDASSSAQLKSPRLQSLLMSDTSSPNALISSVLSNVQDLALQKDKGRIIIPYAHEVKLPIIPDLIRKLAEKRMQAECSKFRNGQNHIVSLNSSSSVQLKIPSYKPSKLVLGTDMTVMNSLSGQSASSGSKVIGETLKEIIAKNINQKVQSRSQSTEKDKQDLVSNGDTSSGNEGPAAKKPKKIEQDQGQSILNQQQQNERRTRPKRGRYRNYNRDNLAEAVRAVQRGEMSVHRAGSFYGVPHSTLEYKVKERHLLRPKKPRDNRKKHRDFSPESSSSDLSQANGQITANSTVSGHVQNGIKSEIQGFNTKLFSSVPLSFPSPSLPLWHNGPYYNPEFNHFAPNHFFASQMMRKLQEDARMHAELLGSQLSPPSSGKLTESSTLDLRKQPSPEKSEKGVKIEVLEDSKELLE